MDEQHAVEAAAEASGVIPAAAVRAIDDTRWHSDAEITGIMIGTPCYGGLVTSRYITSALGTAELLKEKLTLPDGRRLPVSWCLLDGESLIQRARNAIVAKFMAAEPKHSHLIFIDADLEWTPNDVLRLIAHDLDVVFGIYPKKCEPVEFAFHAEIDETGRCRRNPVTGAIRIARGSTGFMCIKRRVFEVMAKEYPRLKLQTLAANVTAEERRWTYGFFDAYVDDSPEFWKEGPDGGAILWSEDYGFCNRWRDLSGEIWMDPEIKLAHIGPKIYRGDVADVYKTATPGVDTIRGWRVPADDPWFVPQLRADGELDRPVIDAALAYVSRHRCAVDVGAHIGTWTRPLAREFERVVAIEPFEASFRLLAENADGDNVRLVHGAAWNERVQLEACKFGVNSGEVGVRPVNGAATAGTVIPGIPLDTMDLDDVDLLKIDVEGAELKVLEGAELLIHRNWPVIVLEESPQNRAAAAWLTARGYSEVARLPLLPGHPKDNVIFAPAPQVRCAA